MKYLVGDVSDFQLYCGVVLLFFVPALVSYILDREH